MDPSKLTLVLNNRLVQRNRTKNYKNVSGHCRFPGGLPCGRLFPVAKSMRHYPGLAAPPSGTVISQLTPKALDTYLSVKDVLHHLYAAGSRYHDHGIADFNNDLPCDQ